MKWISHATRHRIYWRDGMRCVWCGTSHGPLSLDHVLPRSVGGSNKPDNLVTACCACNAKRDNMSAIAFAFACLPDPEAALDRMLEAMSSELPVKERKARRAA